MFRWVIKLNVKRSYKSVSNRARNYNGQREKHEDQFTSPPLSLEIETSFKYLVTSRTLVSFLDGLVPCLR
ncbi:hypothetical protein DPMN_005615 [Dreissena polymorpha]|uniref:Uncharacterized protein n=1 Tax=Dreissena polymorpha TaxID=45954 RepID=A0A9D4MQL0_DREPO|nr:hypothetical protein DPMN_005615 [Dreissena polymorpha]